MAYTKEQNKAAKRIGVKLPKKKKSTTADIILTEGEEEDDDDFDE